MQKAVEEFKAQTRALGMRADSPRRSSGTQSRGSRWHGRLFENFRNDALDAVPHEIVQRGGTKSLLRRNQFGFNVSGPLVLPKLYHGSRNTFFSISYEGVRERISRSYLRTIPIVPERTGDFSQTVDSAGNPLRIFDPATTRLNSAYDPSRPVSEDNLQYLRDPFPGNAIPAHRLSPVSQKALTFYPLPNTSVGPFFRNNYFSVSPETNSANGMIAKIDHNLSERHRAALGLSWSDGFAGAARYFETPADPGPSDRAFSSRRASVEHVFTISPRTLNTAEFEASSDSSESEPDDSADYAAQIGLRGSAAGAFPIFRYGYLGMGRSNPFGRTVRNTFGFVNSFSTRRGKHNIRIIGQFTQYQVNVFGSSAPSGSFEFSAGLTSLPGIVNTGDPFASYLLGGASFAEASYVVSPSYFRRSAATLMLRESYEVTRGLTLALGLNIDMSTPRVEKYDRQATVDLRVINPENGRPGALVAAGRDGRGGAFQPTYVKAEPSASIAWSPGGNTSTVLRGSFSRSYSAIPIYGSQWGSQGFSALPTYISPNTQLQPALRLEEGLPPPPPLPDLRPEAANHTYADLIDQSDRQPVYQSASISVERELPASVVITLGAGYAGGRNLLVGNSGANPNAISLDALRYRDRLNDEAFNRSLRPYPQYKGFDVYSSWPIGHYEREAAYIRLEKRTTRGLSVGASYEFSKQLDDYSGPYGVQDYIHRENEWSLTSSNNPHRLSLTYMYELPFGPNRAFLSQSDWRRYLAEGWSISGLSSLTSGEPLALRPQFNNTGNVVQALRVNVVPGVNPHVDNPGPELWFNPAAFSHPDDFTIGNGPRTHPSLLGPAIQNHDISITKRFSLPADRALEFSASGFNFVNHANWNEPDVVIGSADAPNVNAGKIIGSRGGRVIQVGMRVSF
jgi:hypothetical protein